MAELKIYLYIENGQKSDELQVIGSLTMLCELLSDILIMQPHLSQNKHQHNRNNDETLCTPTCEKFQGLEKGKL